MVGLYSENNSHAEIPSYDNYSVDVCFGGMSCVARSACGAEEEAVLSLYNDSNSHLADGDFSGYSEKICCNIVSVLEWRDMMGNVITEADVGDTVRMVKTNAASGVFEIWEDGFLGSEDIRTVALGNEIYGVMSGSSVFGDWSITEGDMGRVSDYENFYFEVDGDGVRSEEISIDLDGDDDFMNVSIVSPGCADSFDEGSEVTINVTAFDSDDLIVGNVTVGGVVVPFSNGGVVFNYTFDSPGNRQVIARAVNSRGERSRDIVSVMVLDMEGASYVDRDYVAACIDKPADFSRISESYVYFDASGTRAIRVSGGVPGDILPGSTSLNFYWTFFPDVRTYGEQYDGTGNSLAYIFGTVFADAGDNSVVLRVELV